MLSIYVMFASHRSHQELNEAWMCFTIQTNLPLQVARILQLAASKQYNYLHNKQGCETNEMIWGMMAEQ